MNEAEADEHEAIGARAARRGYCAIGSFVWRIFIPELERFAIEGRGER